MKHQLVTLLALAAAVPAAAEDKKDPCPPGAATGYYPWVVKEIMGEDRYAEVYLSIDAKGQPLKCGIGRNNIPGDDKFFVCNAFMTQWKTAPPLGYVKGKASTEKRMFVQYGVPHRKAERKARKQYFKDHPNERPSCYPEY